MSFSPDLYVRTLSFAARAHGDQQTPTGLPYVVHVTSVCMELIRALHAEPGRDGDLAICCALLHDVLEDTQTPRAAVEQEFGPQVTQGVLALSKDATLPKAERMADSLRRIRRQPPEVAMVKLADRITNLAPPPPHWTAEKIGTYRAEAEEILRALGEASAFLSIRFRERLSVYPAFR
ncbi:MAG: Guanosine polyphosphate pyrophosphohydrolase/synthetase [Myxococcaceae bacterium]|nr:Guanosine polyphosphate pyrophosphohydrolase/synthetase [Myxococcaceae bacterium]